MPRSLIPVVEDLSPAVLTVMAQTMSPNNQGELKWDVFFPRENVDSVDLNEVTTLDFRPTSDRREWNSPGRLIPDKTPDVRNLSIVPVEGYYKWGEYEMQKMNERANADSKAIDQILGRSIPGKVTQIVQANYRRVEVDAFTAWATGVVTAKNPQTGTTHQVSFGFDSARLTTAGTAWNDPGVDAYATLIAWLEDAIDAVGPIQGVVLRIALLRAIQTDAPDLLGGVAMTRAQLSQRIQDDIGYPFTFYLFDDTLETFTDGGTATSSVNVWPAGRIAAVPQGGKVGRTAFAPVVRAMELARAAGTAGIDERGMTVYYDEAQTGKELKVEVQCNPFTIPNEQKLFVENTLVT
jgi:hypothetical protein